MFNFIRKEFNQVRDAYRKKDGTDYHLAGVALFEFVSFRLPKQSGSFFIILLRVVKDIFTNFSNASYQIKTYKNNSGVAILEVESHSEELRVMYVKEVLNKQAQVYINKDKFIWKKSVRHNMKTICIVFFLFFKLLLSKKKSDKNENYALLLKELIESANFLYELKRLGVTTVIDFANYEVDSNFIYLLMKKNNISVYKVPSPGPLYMHNEILLTDYLVLSSGYQLEEIEFIKTIKAHTLVKGIPELGLNYLNKYIELDGETGLSDKHEYTHSIGYYSHGSWLRTKQKNSDNGLNIKNSEEKTLGIINEFLRENQDYHLKIFLHPKEKKYHDQKELATYYSSLIDDKRFSFAPFQLNSADSFDEVNIAVVALSTILFERLFVARKVLICKIGVNGFPIPNSSLNAISFDSLDEFKKLILRIWAMPNKEFYKKFNLENHTYLNFLDNVFLKATS